MAHGWSVDRVTLCQLGGNGRLATNIFNGEDRIELRLTGGEIDLSQTKMQASGKSHNDERCWKSATRRSSQYAKHHRL